VNDDVALTFETAGATDLDTMAELWVRAHTARTTRSGQAFDNLSVTGTTRDILRARIGAAGAWFVLVRKRGQVVGMAHGLPARERDGEGEVVPGLMHLSMVAVDPDHWGRGIGYQLTEHALRRAQRSGFEKVQLWTHQTNLRARRLYESLGFLLAGREKLDERGESIVLYGLAFPPGS
jgi:ribosomal protein S18 acetylase RimI-like enzyme